MKPPFLVPMLAVLLLVAPACAPGAPPVPKGRPAPHVVVAKPAVRDLPVEVRAPVELRPWAQVDVVSKVAGHLASVNVERGDVVRAGEVLAAVRPGELADQATAAGEALTQAEAAATLAGSNLKRAEVVADSGRLSTQELEQARTQAAQTTALAASLRAQRQAAKTRLSETTLVAPFDGVVVARRLDPGALVGPGSTTGAVITLARTDRLRAVAPLADQAARDVRPGQPATLDFDAADAFRASVSRLSPTADPATRTREVEFEVDNAARRLVPGLYGRVRIETARHDGALTLPSGALPLSGGRHFAFVLAGEQVKRTPVTVGVDGDTWLEVTSGLTPDSEVVVAGVDGLSDGAKVRAARGVDPFAGPKAAPPSAEAK
jgi:RND family efflux transporter MFP subunit